MPTTPIVVIQGADDAGDMRAVTVTVVLDAGAGAFIRPGEGAVDRRDHVQLGVIEVDAGIDDRHIGIDGDSRGRR